MQKLKIVSTHKNVNLFKILKFISFKFNFFGLGVVVINNLEFLNETCTAAIEIINSYQVDVIAIKEWKKDMKSFLNELDEDIKVVICDNAANNVRNFS